MKDYGYLGFMNLKISFLKSVKFRALIECYDENGKFVCSYRLSRISLLGHEYRSCLVRVLPSDESDCDDLDVCVYIFSGDRSLRKYLEMVHPSHKVTFGYSFE